MPGAHYRKLRPGIRKVQYVEVHTRKQSFYKPVTSNEQPSPQVPVPPSPVHSRNHQEAFQHYSNLDDIPIYTPPHGKVSHEGAVTIIPTPWYCSYIGFRRKMTIYVNGFRDGRSTYRLLWRLRDGPMQSALDVIRQRVIGDA